MSKEGEGMIEDKQEPQPIEFHAVYSPDGKLSINCPLMSNPLMMKGFMEMLKESVNAILAGAGERDKPKIHKPGSFLDGLRGRGK